jgi:uncharacterized membrane protein (UPF0127 family)
VSFPGAEAQSVTQAAIVNERTGQVVASSVEIASTRRARRKGLLGREGVAPGAALVITPCNAVHTFGMRFPIDVAFVDASGVVRKVVRGLAPWRIALSPRAAAVIEVAAGGLSESLIRPGDRVAVVPTRGDPAGM